MKSFYSPVPSLISVEIEISVLIAACLVYSAIVFVFVEISWLVVV